MNVCKKIKRLGKPFNEGYSEVRSPYGPLTNAHIEKEKVSKVGGSRGIKLKEEGWGLHGRRRGMWRTGGWGLVVGHLGQGNHCCVH